ncbi:hypothetical protein L1987_14020 [Smallanthus sonchifolius]|uniref:Uncharacterized protein n=1 Tax=Smallanthus sonchifolius TaxID=185202 RepID=A0ACB9JIJ9_9ASTR|nr:hypothetical protein L1987_14020 [Smallanthus sonchifolius]
MSLRLGHIQTLVVSSAKMAKEILKTNYLVFCTRPVLTGQQKLSYDNKNIALSPYNEYLRQMRKICTLHLFSMKQVNSFRSVREEEVFDMIDRMKARSSTKQLVNLSDIVMILTSNIICRVAFGKKPSEYDEGNQDGARFGELMLEMQAMFVNFYYRDYFPLMGWLDKLNGSIARLENIFKDIDEFYQELIDEHVNQSRPNKMQDDMTSASTVEWAMTMLVKNPDSLKNLQQEVRNAVGGEYKKMIFEHSDEQQEEEDVESVDEKY